MQCGTREMGPYLAGCAVAVSSLTARNELSGLVAHSFKAVQEFTRGIGICRSAGSSETMINEPSYALNGRHSNGQWQCGGTPPPHATSGSHRQGTPAASARRTSRLASTSASWASAHRRARCPRLQDPPPSPDLICRILALGLFIGRCVRAGTMVRGVGSRTARRRRRRRRAVPRPRPVLLPAHAACAGVTHVVSVVGERVHVPAHIPPACRPHGPLPDEQRREFMYNSSMFPAG
ncbi:hypothetical protein GGX14DRAFT_408343 [Mycena pura]|uniref:Uncharacterized protein n=1 Tax=Mycena pura TaxID=153505 RepID=A0AAD6Y1F1_9AGAR|nr:hypothetical protein GGX14DRAFT_408343 [Mycena pura]